MPTQGNPSTKLNFRRAAFAVIFLLVVSSLSCALPFTGTPSPVAPQISSTPTTPAEPTATPNPLPPELVESNPPMSAEMPLKGPITLYFNQPMDHASVEAALTSQMKQELTFNWVDDTTVIVYLDKQLSPETALAFDLGAGVRSRQGLSLTQPISLNFRTAGYLHLAQYLPEKGASEVDPSAAVLAAFNRPVTALGADPATLPPGFTLDPPAKGNGEWLNTSTYIFYPDPALEGGKSYTVQINPELKSTDGSPLKESFAWSFSTAMPKLLSVEPVSETPWPLDAKIKLTFNQPMDQASVETNFSLIGPDGVAQGQSAWNEDATTFTFTPNNWLARNTTYTLALNGQTQARGGSQLGEPLSMVIVTYPNLSVASTEPLQDGSVEVNSGVALHFSAPLPNQDLSRYFSITPAISNFQVNPDQTTVHVWGSFAPTTNYAIKVSPTLTDTWGGALGQEYSFAFRTSDLQPNLSIVTTADAIFLTPQDISLIVQAVNIPEVPLTVGTVPMEDLFKLLGPQGYEFRNTYQPVNPVSWTQTLNLAPNQNQTVPVFLSPDQKSLSPGIYSVRLDFPQTPGEPMSNIYAGPYLVVVSNVQMTFKISASDALVWAIDLRTGTALPNAPVSLFLEDGSVLAAGQTDAEGIFQTSFTPLKDPYSTVYAALGQPGQDAFGMTFSSWYSGVGPWDFGIDTANRAPGLQLYLYTDRPIYRPGQTVYFRAVARQAYNGRYTPPGVASLPIKIFGNEGKELANMELPLGAYGAAHGQFVLPNDAQPGYYSISSPLASDATLGFQVANYRKPEINLTATFPGGQVLSGDKLSAAAQARYFFDAPGGNLPVHWALYANRFDFSIPGYQVGPEDLSWLEAYHMPGYGSGLGPIIAEGDGKTDATGALTVDLGNANTSAKPKTYRQRYTLEVTLTDESGLPVTTRGMTLVNPEKFYIGVRPDAWVSDAGKPLGFDIQTVDWEQKPAGDLKLRGDFQKVIFVRSDPATNDPYEMPQYTPQYTSVGSTDFVVSPDGQARLSFNPPEPGTYMLDVFDPSLPQGQGTHTQVLLWISGPGGAIWPNLPNSRLRMVADRDAYQPGDTAQVFIPNPFGTEVQALLTVERSVVISRQILKIAPQGYNLTLPLTGDDAPNIILALTMLGRNSAGVPDFRQSYINLPVKPLEQELKVTLLSQPARAGPGDQVTFEIQVTDSTGKPVQGEFSLAVVDKAVLALADPNSQDILSAFYGAQPSGVRTSLTLAVYNRRLMNLPLGLGGGGGDEAPSVTRENFPDTAYWNAEIVTGADGKATVSMNLPDNLTTWQLDTRGITLDTRVGQTQGQVISTKDLLVRPVTPRFLVANDHAQLSAVVQNNSAADLQVQVSLTPNGFKLDDAGQQTQALSLPAGGRARVEWWGVAQDVQAVDLVFSADGQDAAGAHYQDAARPALGELPVLRFYTPQTYRTSGVLEGSDSIQEQISLPRSYQPTAGSLNIELSPSLASAMLRALGALESQPFNSTEQILSNFLPNLETYRTLQQFGIQDPSLKTRLDRALNDSLVRLLDRQNYDGSWAWQSGGAGDAYITSYVLFGLSRAREAGISINQPVIDQAVSYLQSATSVLSHSPIHGLFSPLPYQKPGLSKANLFPFAGGGAPVEGWEWDRLAFMQYALLLAGAPDATVMEKVFQTQDKLSPWAKALLALSLEKNVPGSDQAQALFATLQDKAIRSATGAYWEMAQDEQGALAAGYNMHTDLSNSAVVLYALAQRDPASPLAADTLRFLMSNRTADGAWSSSYTTAWTLIALNEMMIGTGELGGDFTFSASVNNNPVADGKASGADQITPVTSETPIQRLYADYPNVLSIQRAGGQGRLYYTAGLTLSQPVEKASPLSDGLTIERAYYPASSACAKGGAQTCSPLQAGEAGQKISVRLTLTLPHDVYYLAVTDYIPAGAEILDLNLKTTQIGTEGEPAIQQTYDPRRPYEKGWGWWLFNQPQIYDDHLAWTVNYLSVGSYQLTYTMVLLQPGQYRALPARAWQLYFPEVQANTAGAVFEIKP